MRNRRLARTVAIAAIAALALLLTGSAIAAVFDGQTRQNREVKLRAKGERPNFFSIEFKAPCRQTDEVLNARTQFERFGGGGPSFRGNRRYTEELRRGFSAKIKANVRGQRRSPSSWAGRFSIDAKIRKNGEVRDRCVLRNLPWRVSRD